ncbi:MAG: phage tail sheath family protein [Leptolyngbyaceae cyanobacterium SL_7_1]|nr:phage tail sheath family protein [Leptolyngbyaceae cyanobacterium SL_7_1]
MPVAPTYPGVYIEEIPSGVRTITGVATSITAFIGRALKGEIDEPVQIQSFSDFERQFGGLWEKSPMSYAIDQYFLNGGQEGIVVRVYRATDGVANEGKSSITLGNLVLNAASPGEWGRTLQAGIDHRTRETDEGVADDARTLFNLTVQQLRVPGSTDVIAVETLRNLSIDPNSPRFFRKVIELESSLVDAQTDELQQIPASNVNDETQQLDFIAASAEQGDDGTDVGFDQMAGPGTERDRKGLYALEKADLFNLLCIPPLTRDTDVSDEILGKAVNYCQKRRAMLIVDAPSTWTSIAQAETGVDQIRATLGGEKIARNAALFFPRLKMADALKENRTEEFAPCGVVAGIFARTDATRGVWKAPAGTEAGILGIRELSYKMNDGENGRLNPKAVNCIRFFRDYGNVVWGARTLAGSDSLASEWKYVPVRRLALFLEESLYRGTQWVVFEPNDEPLWAQIRLNIGAFMNTLFRQGAFQGKTPREAYFVRCDKETTTQNDIDRGIVNIIVGFAPLKPAEFVIIKFQQIAGQIQT